MEEKKKQQLVNNTQELNIEIDYNKLADAIVNVSHSYDRNYNNLFQGGIMMKQLSDVCIKASSNIMQKDIVACENGYPIYGASGLIGFVDFYQMEQPYIAVVKDGAGVGRIMKLPAKSSVIGTLQYIIPNNEVDIGYLAYAMENMNLSKYFSGATIPHIYFKDYQKEKINIPIIERQKEIAEILDKVSGLIEKRKQQLLKLDELVKSRFIEMFGDCKNNPKQWETRELKQVAEVGSSKRVFVEELKSEGIPFYRGTEVGALAENKKIVPELFITEEHYKELCEATGVPQIGDLLMPSICPDGRIWLVNTKEQFYFKDGRVLWVHNINPKFNSIFLQYTLRDRIMTDYLSIASGTTFAELKIFSLKECQIFNVPIELQNQFAEFVEQVEKQKANIKQSLEKLEILKKSLMQKYFG